MTGVLELVVGAVGGAAVRVAMARNLTAPRASRRPPLRVGPPATRTPPHKTAAPRPIKGVPRRDPATNPSDPILGSGCSTACRPGGSSSRRAARSLPYAPHFPSGVREQGAAAGRGAPAVFRHARPDRPSPVRHLLRLRHPEGHRALLERELYLNELSRAGAPVLRCRSARKQHVGKYPLVRRSPHGTLAGMNKALRCRVFLQERGGIGWNSRFYRRGTHPGRRARLRVQPLFRGFAEVSVPTQRIDPRALLAGCFVAAPAIAASCHRGWRRGRVR